jgi:hypothetical protein
MPGPGVVPAEIVDHAQTIDCPGKTIRWRPCVGQGEATGLGRQTHGIEKRRCPFALRVLSDTDQDGNMGWGHGNLLSSGAFSCHLGVRCAAAYQKMGGVSKGKPGYVGHFLWTRRRLLYEDYYDSSPSTTVQRK